MAYVETRNGEFNDQFGPFRPVDGHLGKPQFAPRSCDGTDIRNQQEAARHRNATIAGASPDDRHRAPTTPENQWHWHGLESVYEGSRDLQRVAGRSDFNSLGLKGGAGAGRVQGDVADFYRQRAAIANAILWALAVGLTFIAAVRITVAELPVHYHPRYVANEVR